MAVDYTPPTFSGGIPTGTKLTQAFADIEAALLDAMSLSGNIPNGMESDLDLNGNDLLNVGGAGGKVLTSLDIEELTTVQEGHTDDLAILFDFVATTNNRLNTNENDIWQHSNAITHNTNDITSLDARVTVAEANALEALSYVEPVDLTPIAARVTTVENDLVNLDTTVENNEDRLVDVERFQTFEENQLDGAFTYIASIVAVPAGDVGQFPAATKGQLVRIISSGILNGITVEGGEVYRAIADTGAATPANWERAYRGDFVDQVFDVNSKKAASAEAIEARLEEGHYNTGTSAEMLASDAKQWGVTEAGPSYGHQWFDPILGVWNKTSEDIQVDQTYNPAGTGATSNVAVAEGIGLLESETIQAYSSAKASAGDYTAGALCFDTQGRLRRLNSNVILTYSTVADVTARDALVAVENGVVYVTSTGTFHLYQSAAWADTSSASIPVVAADPTVDPMNSSGYTDSDWLFVLNNTPHQIVASRLGLGLKLTDAVANTVKIQKALDDLGRAGGGDLILDDMYTCNNIVIPSHVVITSPNNYNKTGEYKRLKYGLTAGAATTHPHVSTSLTDEAEGAGIAGITLNGTYAPTNVRALIVYNGKRFTNTHCTFIGYGNGAYQHLDGNYAILTAVMVVNCSIGNRSLSGLQPVVHFGPSANDAIIDGGEISGSIRTSITPTAYQSSLSENEWIDRTVSSVSGSFDITLDSDPGIDVTGWLAKITTSAGVYQWDFVTVHTGATITLQNNLYPVPVATNAVRLYPTLVIGLLNESANLEITGRPVIEFCDINYLERGTRTTVTRLRGDFSSGPNIVIDSISGTGNLWALAGSHALTSEFDQVLFTRNVAGKFTVTAATPSGYAEKPLYPVHLSGVGTSASNIQVDVLAATGGAATQRVYSKMFIAPVVEDHSTQSGFYSLTIPTGTPITLPLANISQCAVTSGATLQTINAISGGYDGKKTEILIRGTAGNLTITPGSLIKTPDTANPYVLQINRVYTFRWVTGVCYVS